VITHVMLQTPPIFIPLPLCCLRMSLPPHY
jgi:hypothetical protein